MDGLANQIADVIRSAAPEVVVTWDPSGGYGHPDNIMVHHGATAGSPTLVYVAYSPTRAARPL